MSDMILISKVGLYETIRCAICKNPNQTERGCDGSCQYDKELYEKITEAVMGLAEQRPHGEWKTAYLDHVSFGIRPKVIYCSECQMVVSHKEDFCEYCGSDNRKREGEKNESDHL